MAPTALTIHIDGAARGNPGPAAFAYVIAADGAAPIEGKGYLGSCTNNKAEYTALVKALERASQLAGKRLMVFSDSELLVKQMNGLYRVKNEELRALYEEAKRLCAQFDLVTLQHVLRAQNAHADRLCNEILDDKAGRGARPNAGKQRAASTLDGQRDAAMRDEAVTCLRAAALSWARGDPANPPPEMVWDQLWTIVADHGVLRQTRPR
jgi:ribonuclease HI